MRCAVTFSISEQQTAHPAGLLILAGDLKHAELKYQYYQIYTSMLIFQQAESKKKPPKTGPGLCRHNRLGHVHQVKVMSWCTCDHLY